MRKIECKPLVLTCYFTLENSFLNFVHIMHSIIEVIKSHLRDSELSYPKLDSLNKVFKYRHKETTDLRPKLEENFCKTIYSQYQGI